MKTPARTTVLSGLAAVVALALGVAACAPAWRGAPMLEPLVIDTPELALGQKVFYDNCHQCHTGGSKALGLGITNKPLPSWMIKAQVRAGIGQMPSFSEEEISDRELDALTVYIDALRERLVSHPDSER